MISGSTVQGRNSFEFANPSNRTLLIYKKTGWDYCSQEEGVIVIKDGGKREIKDELTIVLFLFLFLFLKFLKFLVFGRSEAYEKNLIVWRPKQ